MSDDESAQSGAEYSVPCLLVVDDERSLRYSLEASLKSHSLRVLTAETGRQGIELVASAKPDVVLLDVRLPDMSGLDAFQKMREVDSRLPVVIFTAYSTTETAIEATRHGAFEYLLKPVDLHVLRDVVNRALQASRLNRVPAIIEESSSDQGVVDRIIGRSPAMQAVYKAIGQAAPQDVTVLLRGESGTGKELVARAIYHYSRRVASPFVAINAAALPESLLETELFGHERGAFTGAERQRIGKFEQASGGTIFLDEVGDMSLATQARLLRVLQEREFERVGGSETVPVDVRVVAATNQNLEQLVREGRFRQDLFYRLNVFPIVLPPLRDRGDDLFLLVEHFIQRFNRELGKHIHGIATSVRERFERHSWPGNIRELQSTLKSAAIRASGEEIVLDDLPALQVFDAEVAGGGDLEKAIDRMLAQGQADVYRHVHAEVDRILFDKTLSYLRGNQQAAAEVLGISRTTLRAKLRSLGMAVEKTTQSDSGHDDQELDAP